MSCTYLVWLAQCVCLTSYPILVCFHPVDRQPKSGRGSTPGQESIPNSSVCCCCRVCHIVVYVSANLNIYPGLTNLQHIVLPGSWDDFTLEGRWLGPSANFPPSCRRTPIRRWNIAVCQSQALMPIWSLYGGKIKGDKKKIFYETDIANPSRQLSCVANTQLHYWTKWWCAPN